jgi:GNAT superfamily N-acetyltransferase
VAIVTRPADVFDDVATMLGPKRPDANVCWCLSYRIPSKENRTLVGPARGERVRQLVVEGPPGVLAYDGDEVVGWAAVAPRADTTFARNRKVPHVDDLPAWCVWCIRVRPGHRKHGISHELLRGAVAFAREGGAPAIEGYPVDNRGEKVDLTMAYVGTRRLFERARFVKVADTDSVLDGFPRVVMRLDLRSSSDTRSLRSTPEPRSGSRPVISTQCSVSVAR